VVLGHNSWGQQSTMCVRYLRNRELRRIFLHLYDGSLLMLFFACSLIKLIVDGWMKKKKEDIGEIKEERD